MLIFFKMAAVTARYHGNGDRFLGTNCTASILFVIRYVVSKFHSEILTTKEAKVATRYPLKLLLFLL